MTNIQQTEAFSAVQYLELRKTSVEAANSTRDLGMVGVQEMLAVPYSAHGNATILPLPVEDSSLKNPLAYFARGRSFCRGGKRDRIFSSIPPMVLAWQDKRLATGQKADRETLLAFRSRMAYRGAFLVFPESVIYPFQPEHSFDVNYEARTAFVRRFFNDGKTFWGVLFYDEGKPYGWMIPDFDEALGVATRLTMEAFLAGKVTLPTKNRLSPHQVLSMENIFDTAFG